MNQDCRQPHASGLVVTVWTAVAYLCGAYATRRWWTA